MQSETKQKIQLALVVAMVLAAGRAGYIFYQRHEDAAAEQKRLKTKEVGFSNQDYYVTPKKLYPQTLESAKQLTKQPVWVKEGYRYTYYPYAGRKVDFAHEAGLLLPIERLEIKDLVTAKPSGAGNRKQVMAVFEKEGKSFAVPIGYENDEQYTFYSDEMLYIEDPHDLYKHWPAEVWQAVEKHEVKPGMNELQADFAIGMGVPDAGDSSHEKIVRYPNGGKPMVVIYRGGKAADIHPTGS